MSKEIEKKKEKDWHIYLYYWIFIWECESKKHENSYRTKKCDTEKMIPVFNIIVKHKSVINTIATHKNKFNHISFVVVGM